MEQIIIGVIGTGYVGLQLSALFAKAGFRVIAYDKDKQRIKELSQGIDKSHEMQNFQTLNILFTNNEKELLPANYYIAAPPTPINLHFVPDLFALKSAAKLIGKLLKKHDVVVFEPTVYPGATEELLIPILEQKSGLKSGSEFYVGYSPERIVPGDREHTIEQVPKVISGQNQKALDKIRALYERALPIQPYIAPSIKVAESCKLLENIQRDVNIALMNEYAQIMRGMDISIHDVLQAANTKWNFLLFKPGLVGGHCIPLDPYYLIYQANQYGLNPNLIQTARQVNEQFINFISGALLRLMAKKGISSYGAKVALAGISFKANVSDTRHSLSIELYKLLQSYSIDIYACDPLVEKQNEELNWKNWEDLQNLDVIVLVQAHDAFLNQTALGFLEKLNPNGILIDIPGAFRNQPIDKEDVLYWSL